MGVHINIDMGPHSYKYGTILISIWPPRGPRIDSCSESAISDENGCDPENLAGKPMAMAPGSTPAQIRPCAMRTGAPRTDFRGEVDGDGPGVDSGSESAIPDENGCHLHGILRGSR